MSVHSFWATLLVSPGTKKSKGPIFDLGSFSLSRKTVMFTEFPPKKISMIHSIIWFRGHHFVLGAAIYAVQGEAGQHQHFIR